MKPTTRINRAIPAIAIVMGMVFTASARDALPDFDPANFGSPQDNIYWPMAIGDIYHYEAEEEDGLIINEITNEGVTATPKVILGVTCMV
ncbi:MAG: hypothetical protein ACYTAS_08470, partial [Planctomycetota bacterium]